MHTNHGELREMTWTKKEHHTSLMELYYDDIVRSVVDALGKDYHAPFYYLGQEFFAEQLIVEDHPEYAWVWEEEQ